jgi:AcrR family transcriptional regulator
MKRPNRRDESPRRPLSTEQIVDAACELIAASHTDQLTMRKLSNHLGVALGATYHYVPNREALLVLVTHRVNSAITLRPNEPKLWRETLRNVILDYTQGYAEYPGLGTFSLNNIMATGPSHTGDDLIELLKKAGFDGPRATALLSALFFYAIGASATDLLRRGQKGYPAALMRRQFEDGLDLILDGAAAQLRATRRARTQAAPRPV